MNRRAIVGVALAVVLVLAAGLALVARPRGADPISQREALASFREKQSTSVPAAGTGAARSRGSGSGSASVPGPGVYSYDTSGEEAVKLGPLPEEVRPYHDLTTAEVTTMPSVEGDPACFAFALNLLEQHTEDFVFCRTASGGLRLESYAKHQSVAQFNPTVNISCDPGTLTEPEEESLSLECTLVLDGGPMEISTEFSGTARSSGPETLLVGAEEVEVLPIDIHFDLDGSVSGTWDEHLWIQTGTALPVRLGRDFHLDGFVGFDEVSSLQLNSTAPQR
ncbi:MAG: hypothetical protein R2714_16230 [Microthrixaceae bacterium]